MAVTATDTKVRVDRWFYIGVAATLIVLNAIGFSPSLLDSSGRAAPLTPLVVAHAITGTAFLFIFLAQAALVATGRANTHRRLGVAGALSALIFVVLGYLSMVEQARRGFDLSGDIAALPLPPGGTVTGFIMFPSILFLTFAVLFTAALLYRHRPQIHKRLMVLALLGGLSSTPVAHITGHWEVLNPYAPLILEMSSAIFLSVPAIYDRFTIGRIHPVSLWVALAAFLSRLVFSFLIATSAAWDSFATWLIQ